MFLYLKRDNRMINLDYIKEIEYNENINMLYIKADEIYTCRCNKQEYEELCTRIDSLSGVIA